jgi:hypothetical protein
MSFLYRFMPVLAALCTVTGCASAPSQLGRDADAAQPIARPVRAYVTGSRIPVPVDDSAAVPASNSVQQVVTQRDITLTGQTSLAVALRRLVPTLH